MLSAVKARVEAENDMTPLSLPGNPLLAFVPVLASRTVTQANLWRAQIHCLARSASSPRQSRRCKCTPKIAPRASATQRIFPFPPASPVLVQGKRLYAITTSTWSARVDILSLARSWPWRTFTSGAGICSRWFSRLSWASSRLQRIPWCKFISSGSSRENRVTTRNTCPIGARQSAL